MGVVVKEKMKISFVLLIIILICVIGGVIILHKKGTKSSYNDVKSLLQDSYTADYKKRIGEVTEEELDLAYEMSGIESIWSIQAEQSTDLIIHYNNGVESGKFKVIVIFPDDQIVTLVEGNKEGSDTITIPEGLTTIKLVGAGAIGNLKLRMEDTQNLQVKKIGK